MGEGGSEEELDETIEEVDPREIAGPRVMNEGVGRPMLLLRLIADSLRVVAAEVLTETGTEAGRGLMLRGWVVDSSRGEEMKSARALFRRR